MPGYLRMEDRPGGNLPRACHPAGRPGRLTCYFAQGTKLGPLSCRYFSGLVNSGELMMWSAELRLQAMDTSYSTARRSSAFTSTSCGCGVSGSQKKKTASMRPSAISVPSWASPPIGPESMSWMGVSRADCSVSPVVRVAKIVHLDSVPRLYVAHSTISSLRRSWATRATTGRGLSARGSLVTLFSMLHSVTRVCHRRIMNYALRHEVPESPAYSPDG